VEIKLPPLRERTDDIPLFIAHFLKIYSRTYDKPVKRVMAAAQRRLIKHNWPGNVRELQHAVERAVIMSDRDALQIQDFFLADPGPRQSGVVLDSFNLNEVEKGVIRKAISKHGGNLTRAAEELGLTRTSLYRRIQKYDL